MSSGAVSYSVDKKKPHFHFPKLKKKHINSLKLQQSQFQYNELNLN